MSLGLLGAATFCAASLGLVAWGFRRDMPARTWIAIMVVAAGYLGLQLALALYSATETLMLVGSAALLAFGVTGGHPAYMSDHYGGIGPKRRRRYQVALCLLVVPVVVFLSVALPHLSKRT